MGLFSNVGIRLRHVQSVTRGPQAPSTSLSSPPSLLHILLCSQAGQLLHAHLGLPSTETAGVRHYAQLRFFFYKGLLATRDLCSASGAAPGGSADSVQANTEPLQ